LIRGAEAFLRISFLTMKLLLAMLLVASWKTDCEGVPNEDQGEKNDVAKMKKELILMRKEMEREKISIAELRNANAKRQKDGLFDVKKLEKKLTKKLTRRLKRKIEKYFANSRFCDMGYFVFHPSNTIADHVTIRHDFREFEIQFEKAFPRIPKMETAVKNFQKSTEPGQIVSTYVRHVNRTSASFIIYTAFADGTTQEGSWMCINSRKRRFISICSVLIY